MSDLADSLHVIDVSGANVSRLFEEKEGEGFRAVRVQLLEKTLGVVVAELSRAEPGEIHPVSVALSADVLGFPEFLWEREGGYRAFLLGEWARKTLQSICDRLDPLYGHLGVEETLPSPSGFREVCDRVRGEFYLSKRLVGVRKDFLDALTLDYGSGLVSTWHKGFFICSWPPFGGLGLSDEEARSLEVKVTKFVAEMLGVGRLGQ
ncbi:hypothetical protein [Streptoalloteichus hindustanus]|uniref:hypothetical protein n=1 Tax=Streptoalloteichus hindustanus TaxID=2017 RepID=UPI0011610D73|nr:hypothetical protein [Streptoalloteichus hindustanus]